MTGGPVLCMTGSVVTGCFVSTLVSVEAEILRARGCDVSVVELDTLDLPVFHERLEGEGLPDAVLTLKGLIRHANVIVIGAPELNGDMTSVLKNAIDWTSRQGVGEVHRGESFAGARGALITASKHAHAGLRAAMNLRVTLASLGVTVLPEQVSVPRAPERFRDGHLEDAGVLSDLNTLADSVSLSAASSRAPFHQMTWADDAAPIHGRRPAQ